MEIKRKRKRKPRKGEEDLQDK